MEIRPHITLLTRSEAEWITRPILPDAHGNVDTSMKDMRIKVAAAREYALRQARAELTEEHNEFDTDANGNELHIIPVELTSLELQHLLAEAENEYQEQRTATMNFDEWFGNTLYIHEGAEPEFFKALLFTNALNKMQVVSGIITAIKATQGE